MISNYARGATQRPTAGRQGVMSVERMEASGDKFDPASLELDTGEENRLLIFMVFFLDITQGCLSWPQVGQIWDFLSPRFVPFRANYDPNLGQA